MRTRTRRPTRSPLLSLLFILICASALHARQQPPRTFPDPPEGFEKAEQMITMRDGVRLFTIVYSPKSPGGPLPFIMHRTPYGVSEWGSRAIPRYLKPLADDGYIFVFQDIRGRYKSEGQFVMTRPWRTATADSKAIDEGTDAYDTIDWLVKNVPNNNGRAGMMGGSYDAWLAVMATLEPHPALRAVSEQASPAGMFLNDDFFHNGAFRLSYGFEYSFELESSKEDVHFKFDNYDTYEWYLRLGALSNADAKYFRGKIPTWNDFTSHPTYDDYWKSRDFAYQLKRPTVPIMHVAGWWDQEDFDGPMKAYAILEKADTGRMNSLVVGPWNHGGWNGEGSRLGKIEFDSPTGKHFREQVLAPWLAHHLKGRAVPEQPEALTFETGSNKWRSHDAWPPRENVAARKLYFRAGGRLSFDAPTAAAGAGEFDGYVSDPAHPVPYRQRPIEATYLPSGSGWYTWLVEDQRLAHRRPDVLSWETEALKEDVTIAGDIVARLFASTTGTDGDWVVKLIDVYPEDYQKDVKMSGYQLMIAGEILRGRFRKSFERPEPVRPGEVNEYPVGLHTRAHTFLKGHKIMVQVQSTWFPVYDRNPQKFVPNIFKAKESDYIAATQRVFRSRRFPSHVELPVQTR